MASPDPQKGAYLLALLLTACGAAGPARPAIELVDVGAEGVRIRSADPLLRVELRDEAGAPLVVRRLPAALDEVEVRALLVEGMSYSLLALDEDGDRHEIAVRVPPRRPAESGPDPQSNMHAGPLALPAIDSVVFPADSNGAPEIGRPPERISLPSGLSESLLGPLGLASRVRDREAPWAFVAVELSNGAAAPLDVTVRMRILLPDGSVAPAFLPRVRERDTESGVVTALLRVPAAGRSRAVLPLFVDPRRLPAERGAHRFVREIAVHPVGATMTGGARPLVRRDELRVRRGSSWAGTAFALSCVASGLGLGLLFGRGRRWLQDASISELVTIALFGNLMFVAGAASHLVALGLASVLGPFASLLTGLLDDALRYALLATLVTLRPRPGTAALAMVVHTLMRGLALGGFGPTDPLMLGAQVFWLEAGLWSCGLTRHAGAWRDEPRARRFLRLALALGLTSLASTALGLSASALLYRLWYAGWFVVLTLGLPGFAYTVVACALAVPFAESLRKVEA